MTSIELYEITLPFVGTQNLVMGMTLLIIYGMKKGAHLRYKIGLRFFALAMLALGVINYVEQFLFVRDFIGSAFPMVVPAASVELFLFFYAYIALLDHDFVSRKRILWECVLIVVFTFPPLFVDRFSSPALFSILFSGSLLFYLAKLLWNLFVYRKTIRRAKASLLNFFSNEHAQLLTWINGTFYLLILIGMVSVIVPLTNYMVLFLYQILLFCTYSYLYIQLIRHEEIFSQIDQGLQPVVVAMPGQTSGFMAERVAELDAWIKERQYAKPGITIEDVAVWLKTNRTTFSHYLNIELHQNFYEWIATFRVEEAKRLLVEQPELSVSDIAVSIGIEDRSNFDKVFKRFVGISAAAYRTEHTVK